MLGIHGDNKLRWGPHIRETISKAVNQITSLSRLAASTWGAVFMKAVILESSPYLHSSSKTTSYLQMRRSLAHALRHPRTNKGSKKTLERIQNTCMRTMTRAYKITEIQIFEHEAGIIPLSLNLDEIALAHTLRTRTGQMATFIHNACQKARHIACTTFNAKKIQGPPSRQLLWARVFKLLGNPERCNSDREQKRIEGFVRLLGTYGNNVG
jgi:hypothetical protein